MADDSRSIGALLTPGFIRRRYSLKFAVSILLVVVVIGSVGAVGYVQTKDTVESNTKVQLQETSSLRASSLSEWTDSMRIQTRAVSASEELRSDQDGTAERYLQTRESRLSADILGMHMVNSSTGEVMASTDPIEGFALEELGVPWAQADLTGQTAEEADQVWVSDSSYESPLTPYTRGNVVAFASAVPNTEDRYVVVVTRIQSHLDTIKDSETEGQTRIINENGGTVLTPGGSIDQNVHGDGLQTARSSDDTAFATAGGQVHAYAPVEGTDWVAITSVDTETAFAVRDTVGQNVLFIVVSGLVALGFVGVVLGRQTVTPLSRLRDRASQMEEGNLNVDLETGRVDEIGRLYDGFAEMRDSLRNQIQEAEAARSEAEAARNEAEQLNKHLERKADEYSQVMQQVADGDLTRRMDAQSENEAMTSIANAFNDMIAQMDETVAQLRVFATSVASASEEVTASAEEVQSASQQVSTSVQEISDGAERQNEQFQSVSAEMDSLSTTTEEIAASSNEVADLAQRTAETGSAGRDAAQDAIDSMGEIEEESSDAVDAIEELEAEMEQIDELIEFISDLAKETNMLALNANIEASRGSADGSGGGGDGFAVVAQQVKELAAETKDAAEDIEDRLEGIQEKTDRTAEEVQKTSKRVSENRVAVENAADALEQIATYAQRTNDGVQEISAASEEQAASTEDIVAMVDEAATISEETTAEAENVAAAAEEQTSSLSEVTKSASSLAQQASQLSRALDRFETESEGETGEGPLLADQLSVSGDAVDDAPADDASDDATSAFEFERPNRPDQGEDD
ncbi:methyl-accepting chemotaxis protein [Haloarchaeobius amylolyticus]|uniref:methyl-accepting chemotaxis protein n=1 Tax=Haloarchaeobius amylolyticus TaxID=1198296 RepID=UPI00226E0198|nr:methyl-accepting chemotaxis protein [Haloarchaeobius amylolyticus]